MDWIGYFFIACTAAFLLMAAMAVSGEDQQ
jgi:hypothetical protein